MRRILVNHVRDQRAGKQGGEARVITLQAGMADEPAVAEFRPRSDLNLMTRTRRTGASRSWSHDSVLKYALLACIVFTAGCRTGRSYTSAEVQGYDGGPQRTAAVSTGTDTLRVVAFNIKYAQRIDRAIDLLRSDPDLRDADVLLLNEMNENGTWLIADALGMHYAYHPAVYHLRAQRDFGNAVLSRWPIVAHERIVLPHPARFQKTQRTATAATIRVGRVDVRVYATHLGTFFEIGPGARQEQLRTIFEDAEKYPRAIVGGDMNDSLVGAMAGRHGFTWPTQYGPRTMMFGRVDHIFLKNLPAPDSGAAGTVRDSRGASDHSPVWALGIVRLH